MKINLEIWKLSTENSKTKTGGYGSKTIHDDNVKFSRVVTVDPSYGTDGNGTFFLPAVVTAQTPFYRCYRHYRKVLRHPQKGSFGNSTVQKYGNVMVTVR